MESHSRRGERIETPDLKLAYDAPSEAGYLRGSVT
jgi:hypothetical protein